MVFPDGVGRADKAGSQRHAVARNALWPPVVRCAENFFLDRGAVNPDGADQSLRVGVARRIHAPNRLTLCAYFTNPA